MDPVSALVVALAAGVVAGLKEAASDAVKSAYAGLKSLLAGRLSSLANLEENPDDPDYQAAAKKELARKGLASDPDVVARARELVEAIERDDQDQLHAGAIDFAQIRAARDILIRNLEATGGVTVRNVASDTGSIHVEGIKAGTPAKN
jgi:hypothetical protein